MAQGFRALAARSLATSYIPYRATAGKIYSPARETQSLMRFGLAVLCGNKQVATFELTLSPSVEN